MADIALTMAFLTIGGIIFAGYLSDMIFKRFGIPQILILLALGYFMGPLTGYLDVEVFHGLNMLVGTLALIILLFDGGLALDIYDVIHRSGRVALMSMLGIILSIIASAVVMNSLFGFNMWVGAVFGAIAGGTASQIVIPIARSLKINQELKQFLTLESSATDTLCVIAAIVLMTTFVSGEFDLQNTGQVLLRTFSIGAVIGAVVALITIVLLARAKEKPEYPYMILLGVLILVYAVSEYFGGSGAISALMFGIIVGNKKTIGEMLRFPEIEEDNITKLFQAEISFFVRTFFFVYMGMLISVKSINVIITAVGVVGALLIARVVAAYISTAGSSLSKYRDLIIVMQAKGITLAVLALLPAIMVTGYSNGKLSEALEQFSFFPDLAMSVIVISIVINGLGVAMIKNRLEEREETSLQKPDSPQSDKK